MPRRHRRAPEPVMPAPRRPIGIAPEWAVVDGATARQVSGDKAYRCPGCQQLIRAGVQHLAVVEEDDVEGRRHWHTECWRRELRRRGHRV
jgi:hypothetical protein